MDEQRVREVLNRLTTRARAGLAAVVPTLRRLAAPVLGLWMRFTISRWERIQRFFATHRDLVEVDTWLDRWYSFGTA
jgi:hypothetical protein